MPDWRRLTRSILQISKTCSRNRNPIAWSAWRTLSSGRVSLERIRDMFADRCSGVILSVMAIPNLLRSAGASESIHAGIGQRRGRVQQVGDKFVRGYLMDTDTTSLPPGWEYRSAMHTCGCISASSAEFVG